MTEARSEPPASSQEAWACRRSCIRTLKETPLALTAGCQIRVRNVLREIGVLNLFNHYIRPADALAYTTSRDLGL